MSTVKISPFGFPEESVIIPSKIDATIARLRRICLFLFAAAVANMCISFVLMPMVFFKADEKAYVADGGVFGCEVMSYATINDVKNPNKARSE